MKKPSNPASHFGKLDFGKESISNDGLLQEQPIRWIPNRRVLRKVPNGFALNLKLLTCDGCRFIRPAANPFEFTKQAWFSGFAILQTTGLLSREQHNSYRLMRLLFDWSNSDRRLHARSFDRLQDLIPTKKERSLLNGLSILPENLTATFSGVQRPVSPKELIDWGEKFAAEEGLGAQPFGRTLDLGLLFLALRSSQTTQIKPDNLESYLSFALFGLDAGQKVDDPKLIQLIEEGFVELLWPHLEDDGQAFNEWISDMSGICRALARRKSLSAVTSDQVRYVLFSLLMKSHRHITQCVEFQMRHVCQLIQPKLTATEWIDAKLWYQRQKWLGSNCSVVFHSRLLSLIPVLTLLHDSPDRQELWPAWVQSMLWKVQIIMTRRELEKQKKTDASKNCQLESDGWDHLEIDSEDRRRGRWPHPRRK